MQMDRDLEVPKLLDRLIELDRALVHLETALRQRRGDIRAAHRAEDLAALAGLEFDRAAELADLLAEFLRLFEFLALPLRAQELERLDAPHRARVGGNGHLLREEEVSGIAVGHGDLVSLGAEAFHVFGQDELGGHGR